MASLIKIPDRTYDWLASEARSITNISSLANFALAEAFPVFGITPGNIRNGSFYATSLWHFQIKRFLESGPYPAGYMRARIYGPREEDWEFCGLFDSPVLATGIDNAITIADTNYVDEDKEARLLVAPDHQLTALWLSSRYDESDRFIIAYLPGQRNELPAEELMMDQRRFRDFFDRLPLVQGRRT